MRTSASVRAARLLYDVSRPLAWALATVVVVSVAAGTAARVFLGVLVGQVPDVVGVGVRSDAGDRLLVTLALAGACFLLSLLAGPVEEALGSVVKARLTAAMQARLMAAVAAPTGVAHVEDPEVLNRLALAQGSLSTASPAQAPVLLARLLRIRVTGLAACCILGWFEWWLGVLALVFWRTARRPLQSRTAAMVKAFGGEAPVMRRANYFHALAMTPAAAKESRVFGWGPWSVAHFREHWLRAMAVSWGHMGHLNRVTAALSPWVLSFNLLVVGLIARRALDGDVGLGTVAVVLPALLVVSVVGSIMYEDFTLQFALAGLPALDRLEADLAVDPVTGGATSSAGMPGHAIEFRSVGFGYPGTGTPVYEALDLVIPAGRSTALVGANGAGKTTLVKLIARLHEPSSGTITVDGVDLRELAPREWQRRVAVVYQDQTHFPVSARDNVAFGAVGDRDDLAGIEAAARAAGASSVVAALDDGWDTVLSRSYTGGTDLSGGQWQRVALARALFAAAHGATVLVLDEPTAHLDIRAEAAFYEHFLELTAGLTTVLISHRFPTVRLADRICVIGDGRVVEQGTHAELMELDGHYASMFRLQAAAFVDDPAPGSSGEPAP